VAIRGRDIATSMSRYLVNRLLIDPRITILTNTRITPLLGDRVLKAIELTTGEDKARSTRCRGVFCFIGAVPATDWLSGVAVDEHGVIRTDRDLDLEAMGETWTALGRAPLPFETSIPSVFAAGDVRHGSMKRVAAAVGEGASAVQSIHAAIGARAL
jgi:thioredoxin reductase (NADPH)